jgi:L-serine dehydratase
MRAAGAFLEAARSLKTNKTADRVEVVLYGSLSLTGKGHGTDRSIVAGLLGWKPDTCDSKAFSELLKNPDDSYQIDLNGKLIPFRSENIRFADDSERELTFQNTIVMSLFNGNNVLLEKEYYSIGGGFIKCEGEPDPEVPEPVYKYENMAELKQLVRDKGVSLPDIILANEQAISGVDSKQVYEKLGFLLNAMEEAVNRGISTEGVLPGPIGLQRKAPELYGRANKLANRADRFLVFLDAYSMAASEENAAGNRVVTAPTSGSAGVIPGVVCLLKNHFKTSKNELYKGMLVAAAIGFIAKQNASISGAEVGCQGEVGVAAAMAAAMLAQVNRCPLSSIENAAEIALEHHLGMTCDPVGGYVQIPCVERNAVGAVSAYNAYLLASTGDSSKQKLTFDEVVEAMLETGRDMCRKYKETSTGGLAVCCINC